MSSYTIKRAVASVPLAGDVAGTPWAAAEVLKIDNYPWYKGGQKQGTDVRMMYDDQNLYVQFRCEDKHIFAKETRHNGLVCLDSCVEFFATIDPAGGPHYFNLEINCCGVINMGFGEQRQGRRRMDEALARKMTIRTSVPGPAKEESASDNGWWVAAKLPFAGIAQFAGKKVQPRPGTRWKANFYRCGGKTDDQYAVWNAIPWEKPDYHRPEFFGDLTFA